MLNIHELERQWLRYKIKSYIPLIVSLLGGISLLSLFLIYFPLSENSPKKPVETEQIEQAKVQPAAVIEEQPVIEPIKPVQLNIVNNTQEQLQTHAAEEKRVLMLKPSLHFMDNIENGLSTYMPVETPMREPIASSASENDSVSTSAPDTDTLSDPDTNNENRLNITSNKEDFDIKDVIRRFKQNKSPALSLFIAKRYYNVGEYQRSYNYALMTNEIDKNIEESWIIFTKSLVKLGQHELAINTLKSYLKTTKSTSAEVLLRNIEAGTFK